MERLIVKLTDNAEVIQSVNERLKERGGICPCALVSLKATEEEKAPFKCMCLTFRSQQTEGPCPCGKYVKVKVR